MTLLISSIFGAGYTELQSAADKSMDHGADAVELRLDLSEGIDATDIHRLRGSLPQGVPLILTLRSAKEGGGWDGGDDERVSRLIELGPQFDYIDVELALWRRSANIRQKVELALSRVGHVSQTDGVETVEHTARRKLILSLHDPLDRPGALHRDFLAMAEDAACDVIKIAWRARSVRDNFEAFDLMRAAAKPCIIICMGDDGLASRVLASKFRAFATFAAPSDMQTTAPGQLSLPQMCKNYLWKRINPRTHVYGLIGNPVIHSLSPALHNAAFDAVGLNAVYLPFRVDASFEAFKAFMVEADERPWLDLRGLSVTQPHKEHALRYLREIGGTIDESAARVGAVNTLVKNESEGWSGFNTDEAAVLESARELTGVAGSELHGRTVTVLGAGGVARAVVSGFTRAGAEVTVYNRTRQRADALSRDFSCRVGDWDDRAVARSWLLVNCTSIGQPPSETDSPMSADCLGRFEYVLDTLYHPPESRLVREARAAGCHAAGGLTMFLAQAATQFHKWTGLSPPSSVMRLAIDRD